ncbi:(deoxy)nucleoside triphosphate pyrophosphohydrolase [Gordonia shandongensis]|uniref:(deoxy)nucleoside triphosphate pyrophosphohydrolase n=1 Tax=Gordonia shandongensis TaxID=376351 RepID=UPI000404B55C|nr:(deoxy)nucleoside triphosphate pyrophosphohydrolase [Gordonia shandongensis]
MTDGGTLVVAGAVLDGGRVLLAQRTAPPELAGLWELPGGKVEAAENPRDALRRELCEELDVWVSVGAPLADVVRPRSGLTLIAMRARVVRGTPRALEHRELRWVGAEELITMAKRGEIVPNDLPWVQELAEELQVRPHEPS